MIFITHDVYSFQILIVFEPDVGFNLIHNHDSANSSSSFHHLGAVYIYIFKLLISIPISNH